MNIVQAKDLTFEYIIRDDEDNIENVKTAVDHVSLDIEQGQFIAILGHNGSGKSTFAKHINALLSPTEGSIWVDGMDTKDTDKLWDIRQTAGMVFQNPDNQIIGTIVEEDVGFGPENLGVPTEEIWERVDASLEAVGMTEYRHHSPNKLSGGQKEVIATITKLNKDEHVTVILITHYMDEVIGADKVFVMDEGKVVMSGTPREVFSKVEQLKALRLDVPHTTELAFELEKAGIPMKRGILTISEFTEELLKIKNHKVFR